MPLWGALFPTPVSDIHFGSVRPDSGFFLPMHSNLDEFEHWFVGCSYIKSPIPAQNWWHFTCLTCCHGNVSIQQAFFSLSLSLFGLALLEEIVSCKTCYHGFKSLSQEFKWFGSGCVEASSGDTWRDFVLLSLKTSTLWWARCVLKCTQAD